MAEDVPYKVVGDPIIGRVIEVPTDKKDDWLRYLNEREGITASLITHLLVTEGDEMVVDTTCTCILVSMSFPYDRPRDVQARLGLLDPFGVMRRIDLVLSYVSQTLTMMSPE